MTKFNVGTTVINILCSNKIHGDSFIVVNG